MAILPKVSYLDDTIGIQVLTTGLLVYQFGVVEVYWSMGIHGRGDGMTVNSLGGRRGVGGRAGFSVGGCLESSRGMGESDAAAPVGLDEAEDQFGAGVGDAHAASGGFAGVERVDDVLDQPKGGTALGKVGEGASEGERPCVMLGGVGDAEVPFASVPDCP